MEKISSILPSSSRVASVDMKEAAPVRPGVPAFGRPEGVSTPAKQASKDAANEAAKAASSAGHVDWRTKDIQQAALAQEVTNNFFARNKQEAAPVREQSGYDSALPGKSVAVQTSAASRPAGFKTDELGNSAAASAKSFHPEISFDEPSDADASVEERDMSSRQSSSPTRRQPDGLYPRGSFIDRSV
jgi:hypothetical protein